MHTDVIKVGGKRIKMRLTLMPTISMMHGLHSDLMLLIKNKNRTLFSVLQREMETATNSWGKSCIKIKPTHQKDIIYEFPGRRDLLLRRARN